MTEGDETIAARFWLFARAASLAFMLLAPGAALAHSGGSASGGQNGLPIDPISHGEMAVVADHRAEIIALANARADAGGPLRRLLNYHNVQSAYCLWGLVPGGVTDEASPFNGCSHAYLAAAKALLLTMAETPGSQRPARDILDRIDSDVSRAPFDVICAASAERFNTASLVTPEWGQIVRDASPVGGALLASASLCGLLLTRRRATRTSRSSS